MAAEPFSGTWEKLATERCAEAYPDRLEFLEDGRYVGSNAEGARLHPIWDVGSYERREESRVEISLANDARVSYAFSVSGNVLTFVDPDGCRFEYRRLE